MEKKYEPLCDNCGESLWDKYIRIKDNKRFCSVECQNEYFYCLSL